MREVTREVIAEWREDVPPPGEAVFDREKAEFERSAMAFLEMERTRRANGDKGAWSQFEYAFGDDASPAAYALATDQVIAIRGKADRIDAMPNGTLRVVDYKTGSAGRFGRQPKNGSFNGGRLLQPALYAAAIGATQGKQVSAFEYRFPTPRGQNEVITYASSELESARPIIASLVADVKRGRFLPTMDSGDCKYCDHQPICRVTEERYAMNSPRADWAALHGEELAEFASMRQRRSPASSESDA
jgi:ATP-dependent helicase/nuclease subunit B